MRLSILLKTKPVTNAQGVVHLYTVTPDMARELLEHNYEGQRMKRPGVIQGYANDMANGDWAQGNSDMIVIGRDGKLYNGQQRLSAVIQSGIPQQFWVLEEADPALYGTMDNGYRRNTTDYLSDLPNAREMNTLSGIFYAMKHGTGTICNCLYRRMSRNVSVTRSNVVETARRYTETLENYIAMAYGIYTRTERKFLNHIAIALMIMDQLNPDRKFDAFVAELKTLSPSSDIVTILRQLMLYNARRIDRSDQRTYNVGLMLTAYQLYCNENTHLGEKQINDEFKMYQHTLNLYNDLLQNQRKIARAETAA